MEEINHLEGLQVAQSLDTSEAEPVYLVGGRNQVQMRLSPVAHRILQGRHRGESFDELAQSISEQLGKVYTAADIEAVYQRLVEKIDQIERHPQGRRSGFWFRLPLLPKKVVHPLARLLSVAYWRPLAYSLLLGMGMALALAIHQNVLLIRAPIPGQVGWAILLFMISLLMHELGHASACVRYGGRPSEIGFTVYLLWPAFYSDVSDAWRLKRWQRVVVDLGGVFFQLAVAAVYVFLYQRTGWQAYQIALALIIGSCLMTLNPVFKFDGYWVFADAFGITNLSKQPPRIIGYYLRRWRGRPVKPLPWPTGIVVVLIAYVFLSMVIWGGFLWQISPILVQQVWGYPRLISGLFQQWFWTSQGIQMSQIGRLITSTFLVMVAVMLTWWPLTRIVLLLWKGLSWFPKRVIQLQGNRP